MQTEMNVSAKTGLTVRDLVTTGVFTALFLVFFMIGGAFTAPNPIATFFMPAACALLTGPVFLLLIARVPKHGPLIILGTILGILLFVTGMYWLMAVLYVVFGIAADFIVGIGKFHNKALNIVAFCLFSLSPMGSYLMLWINPTAYIGYLVAGIHGYHGCDGTAVDDLRDYSIHSCLCFDQLFCRSKITSQAV